MAQQLKRWQGWLLFGGSMVLVFILGLVVSSLLERRAEVVSIYNNRKHLFTDSIVSQNEKFAEDFPREYQSWARTADTTYQGEFNGSQRADVLAARPEMVVLWAGYSFSTEYNTPRGHKHAIEDMTEILRTGSPGVNGNKDVQPGTCWTCKSPDVPRMMREKGIAEFYKAPWSQWGNEIVNTIGCSDCHDARTMNLKPARPAIYEAFQRRGEDLSKQSHQDMRSLVCAQCHTEYYFKGDGKYLTFPQDKGFTVEDIEKYYDEMNYSDYTHKLSRAPILKAQHPDHQIVSPLARIDKTCQTCHREDEETLRQNVYERQRMANDVRNRVEKELAKAHIEAKYAWDKGATEPEMKDALQAIRKSQWRWDFAVASHGASFHAPQEVTRILGQSLGYAQEARLAIAKVLAKHGFAGDVPMPDISSKEKAWAYIGLDGKKLQADKAEFLKTVVPKWVQSAKQQGKLIEL